MPSCCRGYVLLAGGMDLLELVAALELLADIRLRHGAALLPCLREWTCVQSAAEVSFRLF